MVATSVQVRFGFTLLELMVVMAIIALVMGWGLLNVQSSVPSYQLDQEADALGRLLRDARDQAVLSGRAIRVEAVSVATAELAEPDREFQFFWDEPAPGQTLEDFYADTEPFATRSLNSSVIVDRAKVIRKEDMNPVVVRFLPTGVCTSVRFYLCHRRAKETWRTVRLNPLTGLSTVVRGIEEPETYEEETDLAPSSNR